MPSIIYASSLEIEVYILAVDAGLNYVTVSYQSINLVDDSLPLLLLGQTEGLPSLFLIFVLCLY